MSAEEVNEYDVVLGALWTRSPTLNLSENMQRSAPPSLHTLSMELSALCREIKVNEWPKLEKIFTLPKQIKYLQCTGLKCKAIIFH